MNKTLSSPYQRYRANEVSNMRKCGLPLLVEAIPAGNDSKINGP
jgi:hypothetical protein